MTVVHSNEEQVFLDNLDKKLWNAADRLRSNLDAAVYKHAVLGLIFLKYISDSFDLLHEKLRAQFTAPESDSLEVRILSLENLSDPFRQFPKWARTPK